MKILNLEKIILKYGSNYLNRIQDFKLLSASQKRALSFYDEKKPGKIIAKFPEMCCEVKIELQHPMYGDQKLHFVLINERRVKKISL